jgi:hypothetical protein
MPTKIVKNKKLEESIKDLIWLNSIIAIEMIRIAENMAEVARGSETERCRQEHQQLLKKIIKVLGKYSSDPLLKKHIVDHN